LGCRHVSKIRQKLGREQYEGMDDLTAVGKQIVDKVHVIKAKNRKQRFLYIVG
jgi:hypothetical protein